MADLLSEAANEAPTSCCGEDVRAEKQVGRKQSDFTDLLSPKGPAEGQACWEFLILFQHLIKAHPTLLGAEAEASPQSG